MATSTSTDWSLYDHIIIAELPKCTIKELADRLSIHRRAKLLGVNPAIKKISAEHKQIVSKRFTKEITTEQRKFIVDRD